MGEKRRKRLLTHRPHGPESSFSPHTTPLQTLWPPAAASPWPQPRTPPWADPAPAPPSWPSTHSCPQLPPPRQPQSPGMSPPHSPFSLSVWLLFLQAAAGHRGPLKMLLGCCGQLNPSLLSMGSLSSYAKRDTKPTQKAALRKISMQRILDQKTMRFQKEKANKQTNKPTQKLSSVHLNYL